MPTTADRRPRLRLRLHHKLAIAVVALATLLAALLLGFVGPATTADFLRSSSDLVQRGNTAMRTLLTENARESRAVLDDLIHHTADARRRALADLPLALFADSEQLRAFVQATDAQRADRLQQNVAVLTEEAQRRTDAHLAAVLADLQRQQDLLAGTFAERARGVHLVLCAAVLAAALLLFGLGLYQLVVRPVALLRAATQRLAGGDLGTEVTIATGDELGALAADFRTMVHHLQQSRAELAAMNAGLERTVADKTRALAHAEKMASIGTLAGGIAHEFNNLLGGIRGCTQEARADEDDPHRQETLDVILRAVDRAAVITAQLRRFARKDPPREAAVELGAVLADALHLAEPEARRRRIAIERVIDGDLHVRGDDGALHQVFVNLLTNALQAMPDGGQLTVRAHRDAAWIAVAIADTGVGIDPVDRDRVFEPFFTRRGDDADPAQRGTGLGLSVSYGIVDAHGGAIAVQSEPGHGSTFTVRLPAGVR